MRYSKKEKLSLLSDMITVAKSDNELKFEELNFIKSVAKSLEVSNYDLEQIIKTPAENVVFSSESERILQFHRLLLVVVIDQKTTQNEIIALKNFGLKMGLPSLAIDEVFTVINDYPKKLIPPTDLIEIFKKYYN